MKNKNDILDGRKLIADFMGQVYVFPMMPLYDMRWDWLIPVVIKCQRVFDKKGSSWKDLQFDFSLWSTEYGYHCNAQFKPSGATKEYITPFSDSLDEEPIKVVYEAVVKFIKWYNDSTATN